MTEIVVFVGQVFVLGILYLTIDTYRNRKWQ